MGDTSIIYSDKFGINTFKREICVALGEAFWNELVEGIELPDIDNEYNCQCQNMQVFMRRLEERADAETVKQILYKVRHGLHPSQSAWAREKFLQVDDLDKFLQICHDNEISHFIELNREKKDFYGDEITDGVLEFIKSNPAMLAPVRKGNKLYCMAFPANMQKYLDATDEKMKRYHACHCPFAKESILSEVAVSSTLCNCSLGHVMNFTEAFLGRELEGRVLHSVLGGDLTCEYEITLPDDIMEEYVVKKKSEKIASNYYRYYKSFAESGIIDCHEETVSWIMPKEGEKGPSLGYRIFLDGETAEAEIKKLIEKIHNKKAPQNWIITPDCTPGNLIEILERNGFQNMATDDSEPEPAMLLNKKEFQPFSLSGDNIVCRRVRTKNDFRSWIEVVNTALHGWAMIDTENYYLWVENENIDIYLGEIDGIPVSTAATIRSGDTASLEFVSTTEEYRRRKIASVVCSNALAELFAKGVEEVTLSACGESVYLYEKLGFKGYFNNIIMGYKSTYLI